MHAEAPAPINTDNNQQFNLIFSWNRERHVSKWSYKRKVFIHISVFMINTIFVKTLDINLLFNTNKVCCCITTSFSMLFRLLYQKDEVQYEQSDYSMNTTAETFNCWSSVWSIPCTLLLKHLMAQCDTASTSRVGICPCNATLASWDPCQQAQRVAAM